MPLLHPFPCTTSNFLLAHSNPGWRKGKSKTSTFGNESMCGWLTTAHVLDSALKGARHHTFQAHTWGNALMHCLKGSVLVHAGSLGWWDIQEINLANAAACLKCLNFSPKSSLFLIFFSCSTWEKKKWKTCVCYSSKITQTKKPQDFPVVLGMLLEMAIPE